jgi:IclR-like helix-turn-helix domain-containing protein
MAPPPGRLGGTVKMPVQVRMFPEEIAAVDAFAAELSQQSYGAAFSRAEALRIAAMEWLKARQARQAGVTPASPQRAPAAAPALGAAAAPAAPAPVPGVPAPPPPVGPPSRQGQILAALTAAGPQGLRAAEVRQATGVPQGTVASALHGLVQHGQVRKVHDRYVATGPERSPEP